MLWHFLILTKKKEKKKKNQKFAILSDPAEWQGNWKMYWKIHLFLVATESEYAEPDLPNAIWIQSTTFPSLWKSETRAVWQR